MNKLLAKRCNYSVYLSALKWFDPLQMILVKHNSLYKQCIIFDEYK